MLTPDTPRLAPARQVACAFRAHHALHPDDGGALAGFVDWLQDLGCTRADLAVLLAGTPPGHQDGIPPAAVGLWLECVGETRDVRTIYQDGVCSTQGGTGTVWYAGHPASYPCPPLRDTPEAAYRDLLRFVLGLDWAAGLRWGVEGAIPVEARPPTDLSGRPVGAAGSGARGAPGCWTPRTSLLRVHPGHAAHLLPGLAGAGFRPNVTDEVVGPHFLLEADHPDRTRAAPLITAYPPDPDSSSALVKLRQTLAAPDLVWPEQAAPRDHYRDTPGLGPPPGLAGTARRMIGEAIEAGRARAASAALARPGRSPLGAQVRTPEAPP